MRQQRRWVQERSVRVAWRLDHELMCAGVSLSQRRPGVLQLARQPPALCNINKKANVSRQMSAVRRRTWRQRCYSLTRRYGATNQTAFTHSYAGYKCGLVFCKSRMGLLRLELAYRPLPSTLNLVF
jgi:hypothetical protein